MVYGSASRSNLHKMDRIQYKTLKIGLRLMNSTPNEATLVLAMVQPLVLRRKYLAAKYVIRQHYENNNLSELIEKPYIKIFCKEKLIFISRSLFRL